MYYGYGYYGGYGIMLLCLIITGIAQLRISGAYKKYSNISSKLHMTGAEVAARVLQSQGITDVRIGRVSGKLTDHYDPRTKVVNLSDSVYGSTSLAAAAVAAHECGHAVQHAKGYAPLSLRSAMVPVVNFSSKFSWILIMLGFAFSSRTASPLLNIGIILFSATVLFQIVTLPVEFNASHRALVILKEQNLLYDDEVGGARSMLTAAALTYVAAALTAILQLIRLILIANSRGGRRRD
jgi:Zn-dependent membrane protease YugP